MRIAAIAAPALLAGLVLACSDTSAPQPFQPQEKTYALRLTTCVGCPDDTPPLALIWKDGVEARIAVENVTTVGANGSYLALSAGQSSLLQALPVKTFTFSRLTTGAYSGGTLSYGDGTISVSLVEGGCTFRLTWPGVVVGAGACIVE